MCRHWFAIGILACLIPAAHASEMFSWSSTSDGNTLSGNATFSVQQDGSAFELVIVVNNTAPAGTSLSSELTGVYFNISGVSQTALSLISGSATDGFMETGNYNDSSYGSQYQNEGGWESGFWSSGNTNGEHYGIGTSGRNGASGWNDYGTAGDYFYLDKSATFVLTGLTSSQISISDVVAEYCAPGYNSSDAETVAANSTNISPEPATFFEFSAAVILFGLCSRLRSSRVQ